LRRADLLKRDDLLHTGAHKINNAMARPARQTYGQTAPDCRNRADSMAWPCHGSRALWFYLFCIHGEEDTIRQALNVFRMRLLGTEVILFQRHQTLKDAMNEPCATGSHVRDTHYVIGTVAGPIHFPSWCAISCDHRTGTREQIQEHIGRLPDACVACVGALQCHGHLLSVCRRRECAPDRVEAAGEGLETPTTQRR
jgi:tryptophan synthase beta chain